MKWILDRLVDASESLPFKRAKLLWTLGGMLLVVTVVVLQPNRNSQLIMTYEVISLFPADSVVSRPNHESNDLLRIEIHNTGGQPVEGIELRVRGIKRLDKLAMYSNSRRMMEGVDTENLAQFVGDREIYFHDLDTVPPDSSVLVLVWGEIFPPVLGQSVEVRPSKAVKSVKSKKVYGWPLVLIESMPTIFLVNRS